MDPKRRDGFIFVLLGCAVFLLIGISLERAAPVSTVDFRVVYYSARCLLEHRDPYNAEELGNTRRISGDQHGSQSAGVREFETEYLYPPSAFPITVPFAMLPYGQAHVLWLGFTAASLILGAVLIWEAASSYAPVLSGLWVGLLLANAELFLLLGNPAGLAIGLCVIAAWCFLRKRFVGAGVFCMAFSLMLKPHDTALVWLFFVLLGKSERKRALQALLAVLVLSIPATLWISSVNPNWPSELLANLRRNAAHGGLSDPGPLSSAGHGIGMIIDLQTVASLIWDNPAFYNLVSYSVVGVLLAVWAMKTVRSHMSPSACWAALAPVAALSMLPVYHRLYDTALLLLAIPAAAILRRRGGIGGRLAVFLCTAAIALTGSFLWAAFFQILKLVQIPRGRFSSALVVGVQVLPVPLILLALAVFYLWRFPSGDEAGMVQSAEMKTS